MVGPLALEELRAASRRVRERVLDIVYQSGSGHLGAALSQADILVALYHRVLRVDPAEPRRPDRDRFVLSKGHGGLGLVAVLADRNFLADDEVRTFGRSGSALGMHMDHHQVAAVETSTGSLGHGLGVAVGMALGARLLASPARTFCLLSDGECYEGSTWEAALSAAAFGLGRLVAIIDRNRLTMDGFTEDEVPLEPLDAKWRAFGWRVTTCDGHDHAALGESLDALIAAGEGDPRPGLLIAETVKGKGVDFMENQPRWHYGALDSAMYERARRSVRGDAAGRP